MKVGRRHFLKFITAAIVGAQIEAVSGIYRSPTLFVDKKLGFGFKVPNGWYLETFREDFYELLGGQKLAEPYHDDKEILAELGEGMMAALSKYPLENDPINRFSPSITFFKASDDCLDGYQDLLELSSDAIEGFAEVLTDYECTDLPQYMDRGDCVMVRSKSKFLFEHEDLESVLIDNETFFIHHANAIYTIHLYDSPYIGDCTPSEFDLFKESLHIA